MCVKKKSFLIGSGAIALQLYKIIITYLKYFSFLPVELELGCDNVIEMEGQQTILKHPENGLDKIDR